MEDATSGKPDMITDDSTTLKERTFYSEKKKSLGLGYVLDGGTPRNFNWPRNRLDIDIVSSN